VKSRSTAAVIVMVLSLIPCVLPACDDRTCVTGQDFAHGYYD